LEKTKAIGIRKKNLAARIIQLTWLVRRGARGSSRRVDYFEAIRRLTKAFKNVLLQEQELNMNTKSGPSMANITGPIWRERDDMAKRLDRIELALSRIMNHFEGTSQVIRPRTNTMSDPNSPALSPSFNIVHEGSSGRY